MGEQVSIPIENYEKMIRENEQLKYLEEIWTLRKKIDKLSIEIEEKDRWWNEEYLKGRKLEKERDELRKNLDMAKADLAKYVGLQELYKVKSEQEE